MALAGRTAEQVDVWKELVFRSLLKQTLVIEQMLEPTLFENNLDNYPLVWDHVETITFEEV